jgi:hypothetical protein
MNSLYPIRIKMRSSCLARISEVSCLVDVEPVKAIFKVFDNSFDVQR